MGSPTPAPYRKHPLVLILLSSIILLGCTLTRTLIDLVSQVSPFSQQMTLEEALTVTPEDRRPTVLEEMGAPDTFTVHFQTLEGETVRYETWSYFDFQSRFDFIDGELLWTAELEPLSDGSLFPHYYDPAHFQAGMTVDEVRELLGGEELLEIDLAEGDIPGGLGLVGDQILLGFDRGQLVYVETLALSPAEPGQGAGLPVEEEDQAAAAGADPAKPTPQHAPESGTLIFQDDFEGESARAAPLFGEEFMTYDLAAGRGALTSKFETGVVPVLYQDLTLGDFVLEVEITAVNLAAGSSTGVIFRVDQVGGGLDDYYFLMLGPGEHEVEFAAFKDGAFVRDEAREIPEELRSGDGLYRLRLEVKGEGFRVLLNGAPAAAFTDQHITEPGLVRLVLISNAPPETVYFDQLIVTTHP